MTGGMGKNNEIYPMDHSPDSVGDDNEKATTVVADDWEETLKRIGGTAFGATNEGGPLGGQLLGPPMRGGPPHGDFAVEVLRHGVLLCLRCSFVFGAPSPAWRAGRAGARPDHPILRHWLCTAAIVSAPINLLVSGNTMPSADMRRWLLVEAQHRKAWRAYLPHVSGS
jgi:hypothetical protein